MVASDGHSYERAAIERVLQRGNGLSPLTREPLRADVLIPNRALKRRIDEHEEDVLRVAATAAETVLDAVLEDGGAPAADGESSSSEPSPENQQLRKKRCGHSPQAARQGDGDSGAIERGRGCCSHSPA